MFTSVVTFFRTPLVVFVGCMRVTWAHCVLSRALYCLHVCSDEDVELNLRKTQAELDFLTSRYEVASRKWSSADRKQYDLLKHKEQ